MSKRLFATLLVAVLLYGAFAATLVVRALLVKEDFYSPALASRAVYGYESGDLGLLKKSPRKTKIIFPAAEEMKSPSFLEGEKAETFVLDWSRQPAMKPDRGQDRWIEGLDGDEKVELVAFATWFPAPDDPLTNEGDWQAQLTFRDPATLAIIPADRLLALAVPEAFSRLSPPRRYQTPVLRLLFRTTGMAYPHCIGINAGDQRTGARVSYDLSSANDAPRRDAFVGEWLRVDTELLIWHDSPLDCRVRFLTGEPQLAELPQAPGAQVAFGKHLRVQWLSATKREPEISTMEGSFIPAARSADAHLALTQQLRAESSGNRKRVFSVKPLVKSQPDKSETPGTLVRASSSDFLEEHCGVISETGILWNWKQAELESDLYLASIATSPPPEDPLRLVFLPHATELTFTLAGLPDMPNPRTIDDLFDATLPRITLPADITDAESHFLGFIGVGAQIAWKRNSLWDESMRSRLPGDRTFRNTTPQALLNWYLENTPGAHVRYDPDGLILHINEEKPDWREKVDELIREVSVVFFR